MSLRAACRIRSYCLFLLASAGLTPALAADGLTVVPSAVKLDGNFSQVQLVVAASASADKLDKRSEDLTRAATYRSSDEKVARVTAHGQVQAAGNGRATIEVTAGKQRQSVSVEVLNIVAEPQVSFTELVVPLLSKAGCNQAACHAAQHGKGGFKLSVFGYAPDEDYAMMARDRQARRVNMHEPEMSLILRKPTLGVPHAGNKRIEKDSMDYQIVREWIRSGAKPPQKADAQVTKIRVFPTERLHSSKVHQQLRVEAEYNDGHRRDVTPWAKYDSMDDAVVTVDGSGYYQSIGRGQSAVMVRFEGQAEISTVVIPYAQSVELAGWKNNNFIDEFAANKFRELGIAPSGLCDDAAFVRRAYLDATGTLPTPAQATAFLDAKDPHKRAQLIDELLGLTGDPKRDIHNNAYAGYWSIKWADLIRNNSATLGEQGMWSLHNWIKESLRENKPFDKFVNELITARGSIYRSGPANYYRLSRDTAELAEHTAQLFLGVRLACAKCHHHPFEKYSQADYYGFSSFFARVGNKSSIEFGLFGRESVIVVKDTGDVRHPRTGEQLKPTPLDGQPLETESPDRRMDLAHWLTAKDNQFFARNIANRYMGYLLGRGLVEPVDDMRATNPATNGPLLDRLAKEFVDSNYNVKQLMRLILNSRLYQLDSQPTPENIGDAKFYTYFKVKRIGAEALLDAIDQVTGTQTKFKNLPLGTRAIELPDSNYGDYFLTTFGKPLRVSVCECERVPDENLSQALHTLNGDTLAAKMTDAKGRLAKLIAAKKPLNEAVTDLYLTALARRPTDKELAACQKWLDKSPSPQVFYEDLLWSLINSKQFLFIH